MSGNGYTHECYKCGGEMNAYDDYKPHPYVSGECLECGFQYITEESQIDLEEINEMRKDQELKPLKKLAKQTNRY